MPITTDESEARKLAILTVLEDVLSLDDLERIAFENQVRLQHAHDRIAAAEAIVGHCDRNIAHIDERLREGRYLNPDQEISLRRSRTMLAQVRSRWIDLVAPAPEVRS